MEQTFGLSEYLKNNKIISDGAFGTYYTMKYGDRETEFPDGSKQELSAVTGEAVPELANVRFPERVTEIHREYISAGAKLIRTNTFASNTASLKTTIEEVKRNIRAAVACARKAVEDQNVYIAGDMGPIPGDCGLSQGDIIKEYMQIGETFQDEGVDILLFETFPEVDLLIPVIRYLKARKDCFIMLQFCVNQFGYSNAGLSIRKLFADAAALQELDAIGLNCGVGPGHMEQLLKSVDMNCGKYISALPNAGYPKLVFNRLTFNENIEYFTEKIQRLADYGVDIVGGCCGTKPEYIRNISSHISVEVNEKKNRENQERTVTTHTSNPSFIESRKENPKHKLIAVELAPPLNADDSKLIDAAHMLKMAKVDVVTFPDSPSGRTRADSVLMAEKVRRETGLRVMPHICCRDKNAIAIRSMILGAKLNDIHDFLVITGDPVPVLFRQTTKSVFNFDAVGLMKILGSMNEEIFTESGVSYGGAINQNRPNISIEIDRIKKKMAAGAEFFLTQPVFGTEQADIVRHIKEETGALLLVGIMPLVSRRNAIFMKNEMTGIQIPDDIIDRYQEQMTREEGEACGIAIAKEIMAYTDNFADGYYFSFPFNRVHMLKQILPDESGMNRGI